MLLLDDILLSPAKGLMWIFKEIHKQAQEELDGEAERIRDALTELYRLLENGQITEEEFEEREELLLDRLDALEEDEDEQDESDGDLDKVSSDEDEDDRE